MAAVMMVMMTWPLGPAAPGAILSHAETWSQVCIHLPASLHQLIYTTQLHTGINVLIISNQYQAINQGLILYVRNDKESEQNEALKKNRKLLVIYTPPVHPSHHTCPV